MQSRLMRGLIFLVFLQLSACVSTKESSPFISNPKALYDKRITHRIEVNKPDNFEIFLAVMDVHQAATHLVGMTTNGITLFSLVQSESDSYIDITPLYSGSIEPLQLLLFLQLYNYDNLDEYTLKKGWDVKECGYVRCLKFGDRVIATWRLSAGSRGEVMDGSMDSVGLFYTDGELRIIVSRLDVEDI